MVLKKALYVKTLHCDEVVVFDCIVRGTSYKVISLSGIMSVQKCQLSAGILIIYSQGLKGWQRKTVL